MLYIYIPKALTLKNFYRLSFTGSEGFDFSQDIIMTSAGYNFISLLKKRNKVHKVVEALAFGGTFQLHLSRFNGAKVNVADFNLGSTLMLTDTFLHFSFSAVFHNIMASKLRESFAIDGRGSLTRWMVLGTSFNLEKYIPGEMIIGFDYETDLNEIINDWNFLVGLTYMPIQVLGATTGVRFQNGDTRLNIGLIVNIANMVSIYATLEGLPEIPGGDVPFNFNVAAKLEF